MRSVNKVILVWNITKDPQFKNTWSGHAFCTFTLATNRDWFTPNWEKQSLAEFHRIAAWWKLASLCSDFLKKWKLIYIEGYLKTRVWDDENWIKQYRTEVIAQDMIMLNKKWDYADYDWEWENCTSDEIDCSPNENISEPTLTESNWQVDLDWDHI